MELLNQQLNALKFREAKVLSFEPKDGDVELELELSDPGVSRASDASNRNASNASNDSGASDAPASSASANSPVKGKLIFVTAYVVESDSTDSIRLKMDRVYFKKSENSARGKISKIDFLFGEDEKEANITLVKNSSTPDEEVFPLTIKCLTVKWVG
jgi:hypothetical protein